MLKGKKKISAVALALVLSLGTVSPVSAAMDFETEMEIYRASSDLEGAMTLIMESYVGGEVTTDELYDAAMYGMMNALDDYSEYFSAEEAAAFIGYFAPGSYGIGIMMEFNYDNELIVARVYSGSPAEAAGVQEGDVILRINGQKITGSYDENFDDYYALNKESIILRVLRDGVEQDITAPYGEFVIPTIFVSTIEEKTGKTGFGDHIRYMEMTSVSEDTANELTAAIEQMQADGVTKVILDLRGNGGGMQDVAVKICDMLVPTGGIMTTVDKDGVKTNYQSNLEEAPFKNMIVLTDKYTASAAEVIAGALQDARVATIIGEKTYGKGVVQTTYPMMDGSMLKFTTAEYFRRSGATVNLKGILPNINVPVYEVPFEDVIVEQGGTSEELPNIKHALNVLGYDIQAFNNVYDQRTIDVVKKFQTANKLPVTGKLDYFTLYEMNAALYDYYNENDVIMERALLEVGQ